MSAAGHRGAQSSFSQGVRRGSLGAEGGLLPVGALTWRKIERAVMERSQKERSLLPVLGALCGRVGSCCGSRGCAGGAAGRAGRAGQAGQAGQGLLSPPNTPLPLGCCFQPEQLRGFHRGGVRLPRRCPGCRTSVRTLWGQGCGGAAGALSS